MPEHAPSTCLVIHPGTELYGSDRILLESVVGLISGGFTVTVVVPDDGALMVALEDVGARVEVRRLLVLRKSLMSLRGLPQLVAGAVRDVRSAWRAITAARPDVVYVNTVTLPIWPLVARIRGVPSVVHVHEAEGSANRTVKRALYAPLLSAHAVVVNSEFSRTVLADAYPRAAQRAVVVYNGVAGPECTVPPRETIESAARVLYVGRLSPRKGPDVLVDAVGLLATAGAGVELDLVGGTFEGYEWFEAELRRSALDRGIVVRFHGFQPSVWTFLADADIAVVPSVADEPFGNTAVEALLAARPLVVSNTSGLREAAGGVGSAVVVPSGDAQAIADAIERILREWPRYRRHALDGASAVRERFSPSAYHRAIAAVVRGLLRGGGS